MKKNNLSGLALILTVVQSCFHAGITSGIPSAISVNAAHFANVYQGINLVGTMGTEVLGCTFGAMPNTASMQFDGAASGIFCTNATAYTLRNNILSGSATNYGIVSRNSALNGALIEGNTLSSFNLLADLFEEDNSALQTHCNTYQGNVGDVSWDVSGALKNQGNPNNPFDPKPDNRFLWECGGTLLDIRNSHSQPFSYFERQESPSNTNSILKCFDNVNIFYDPASGVADCVIVDPCPNPPYCSSLMTNYNNSGYALPYRNDLLNAYIRMLPTVVVDSLYLPSTTRGITLLAGRNQQMDKRMLVATYAAVGDYTNAQQYLQQVTGSGTETQDFIDYYTLLVNAGLVGRDAYHLTAEEFGQLAPLMAHSSSVSDNVKTLDHILNGVYHPLKVDSGTGGRPGERSEESVVISSIDGLRVLPNPFGDEVRFFVPEWGIIKDLSIFDVSGKTVYNQSFGGGESMLVLNTVFMPQGVLFYRCQLSDGRALRGKIIHSSKK